TRINSKRETANLATSTRVLFLWNALYDLCDPCESVLSVVSPVPISRDGTSCRRASAFPGLASSLAERELRAQSDGIAGLLRGRESPGHVPHGALDEAHAGRLPAHEREHRDAQLDGLTIGGGVGQLDLDRERLGRLDPLALGSHLLGEETRLA